MKEVGVLEAKTNLSALLAEVEATGQAIAITRHGKRVARITPESPPKADAPNRSWAEIAAEITAWREEMARKHPGLAEPYDLREDRDAIE